MQQTQTYYAKSIFASKTFWANLAVFFLAVLELTEVTTLIPDDWQGSLAAVAAVVNLGLRFFSVRPVALTGYSDVTPVTVPSLPRQVGGR